MKQRGSKAVPINVGNLLENALEKWKGGSQHIRGLGEYISNSDDSYRRLDKFFGQEIFITIKSMRGKRIDELIIEDFAEGMSYEDLTDKFFQYFESVSGRERGFKVTGRFGTGGKAYAIMNFRRCWIISVKDGLECRSWFKWDPNKKEIFNGYDGLGYINKKVNKLNGTKIILEDSFKVNHTLDEFVTMLEKSTRIRHVLKNQIVKFRIERKGDIKELQLSFNSPKKSDALKTWEFEIPDSLKNSKDDTKLTLQYFEQNLAENNYIDLSDGISSVADLDVSKFDGRPFSKNINGALTLTMLVNSQAVKEDRKGLEEYDDTTLEIEDFIREKVRFIINEIEKLSRDKEKEVRINEANNKLNELSKFLSKQDLKFKLELKELQRRFADVEISSEEEDATDDNIPLYRVPLDDDPKENLIRGTWIKKEEFVGIADINVDTPQPELLPEFIVDINGDEFAVKVGSRRKNKGGEKKAKKGLQVLMSNNPDIEECPFFNSFHDPVSDRDLVTKGIIWINSVHPIISKALDGDGKILNEHIANFVLMIIAQYYAQKELEYQAPEERDDPILIFRKHYFELQKSIREDSEIGYFEN